MESTQNIGYEELIQRVRGMESPPPALLFWLQHYAAFTAEGLWAACPRFDWLVVIATACGYPATGLRYVVIDVEQVLAERRAIVPAFGKGDGVYTPTLDGAQLFRQRLSWHALTREASRRARPGEDNPRDGERVESIS